MCDDIESIEFIRSYSNDSAIELHATSINDYFLLEALSNYRGKIYLGIGGTTLDEIQHAIEKINKEEKKDLILMYGFQSYPTDYRAMNLSKMKKIKELFGLPVGYADHTAFNDPNNELISILPAANGFNVLEKHYTPDHGKERIDYHSAVGMQQMKNIKSMMGLSLTVFGHGGLGMSKPELDYGNVGPMKKAIVARRQIPKGKKIAPEDLWFKRTVEESTIKQMDFHKLIGLEVKTDIAEDEIIDFTKALYEFKPTDEKDFTNLEE